MDVGAYLTLMFYFLIAYLLVAIPVGVMYFVNTLGTLELIEIERETNNKALIPIYNDFLLGKELKLKCKNPLINQWLFTFGFLLALIPDFLWYGLGIWFIYRIVCLYQLGSKYKHRFSIILSSIFYLHGIGICRVVKTIKKENDTVLLLEKPEISEDEESMSEETEEVVSEKEIEVIPDEEVISEETEELETEVEEVVDEEIIIEEDNSGEELEEVEEISDMVEVVEEETSEGIVEEINTSVENSVEIVDKVQEKPNKKKNNKSKKPNQGKKPTQKKKKKKKKKHGSKKKKK